MPVTIKDIAKAAGVSHTTVSRALKNNPAISVQTRERIQALAQEMGYTPSAVAQSLLSRRTRTIGVVITTLADPFVVKVVEGVEQVAQAADYSVFLITTNTNPNQELAAVETLHRRRVDAIIVTSSRVGSLYSSQLDQIQVPIVLINNDIDGEYLHSIEADDVQGATLAVQHLIDLGHRRIGYIGVNDRPKSDSRRLDGYLAALQNADIEPDSTLIHYPPEDTDFERGQASLDYFLSTKATAVFCYNDVIAIGLITKSYQTKIAIPDQLSIVGFDNIQPSIFVNPPLTTVAQPLLQLGQQAMEMSLNLLDNKKVQDQSLTCELIIRQSTTSPSK